MLGQNVPIKNCLFGATSIVKNSNKEKLVYSAYGIAFDGKDEWSFGNGNAKNVIIFGVDVSSSSHADILNNNFLVLGEGDTFGINGSFGAPEKKFSFNFTKAITKFCLSLHCNVDNSYLLLMEKKSLDLKSTIKMLICQLSFVSEEYLLDLVLQSIEKYR